MKHLFTLPATTALLALAGCGYFQAKPDTAVATHMLNCPHVAVLSQANNVSIFTPQRTDVAALITTAQITGVAGACQSSDHQTTVKVTFKAGFTATNGPANHGHPVTLPYFVALTSNNGIIAKANHSITLQFGGNANSTNANSPTLSVDVPNDDTSASYEVLVGFQMTPDQIAYAAAHPAN